MRARRAFLLAYLVSGAAGLLYEVSWSRLLTLSLGHNLAAVSTVLAAFMGGLAAGAALGGRYAPRLTPVRALYTYALAELTVGVCAITLPWMLQVVHPLLAWTYADGGGGLAFGPARVATSVLIMAVPAAVMGATFPLAVRWFVSGPAHAGAEAGVLYAVNTVGAAAGAALTGFVLLPQLGLRATTVVGVAMNLCAAGVAWWVARVPVLPTAAVASATRKATRREGPQRVPTSPAYRRPGRPVLAAAALALSGFVALTYEVTWTRLLALIVGPTTYAFALLLAAFIAGLAFGASLGARWAARGPSLLLLGAALIVTALGGLLVVATADDLPLRVARLVARPESTFLGILGLEAGALVILLLPTTLALGAALPLGIEAAASPTRPIARDAALVYAGNTLGAIAGSLASGFLLVPVLGLRATAVGAACVAAIGGLAVIWISTDSLRARAVAVAIAAAAVVGAVGLPGWNRALLSSGAYKYAPYVRAADLETALEAGTLLYYGEGAVGTVTVRRAAGSLALAIDGKVDASNSGDMLTQKLLAHVPLLLHPAPRTVGIIGLGSGVTLGAALRHPIARADVIEISPEVVDASSFFSKDNGNALDNPRTVLLVGDARTHLSFSHERYDVIISEPSNPWMAGVAALFTTEFFETLRTHLAAGGIVCQWAHTYDISDADLRSITATFLSVFPSGMLWLVGDGDVLLVAGDESADVLLTRVAAGWRRPGVAEDLATVAVRAPFELLSQFVAAGSALVTFTAAAPVQTDDRMALEFSAPRGIFGGSPADNAARLRALARETSPPAIIRQARDGAVAQDWKHRGVMLLQAEAARAAFDDLALSATLDPGDPDTLDALERAAGQAERVGEAIAVLERLADSPAGRVTARVALARLLASTGRVDAALQRVAEAIAAAPGDPRPLRQQASIFADLGDAVRLEPVVRRLETLAPGDVESLYYGATLALLTSRSGDAIRLAEQALKKDPAHARLQNLLGAAQAGVGGIDAARAAFQSSIEHNPKDPTAYVNLGSLELQAANATRAGGYFAEALALDPGSAAAREGLARAFELTGNHGRAERVRRGAPTTSGS